MIIIYKIEYDIRLVASLITKQIDIHRKGLEDGKDSLSCVQKLHV